MQRAQPLSEDEGGDDDGEDRLGAEGEAGGAGRNAGERQDLEEEADDIAAIGDGDRDRREQEGLRRQEAAGGEQHQRRHRQDDDMRPEQLGQGRRLRTAGRGEELRGSADAREHGERQATRIEPVQVRSDDERDAQEGCERDHQPVDPEGGRGQ